MFVRPSRLLLSCSCCTAIKVRIATLEISRCRTSSPLSRSIRFMKKSSVNWSKWPASGASDSMMHCARGSVSNACCHKAPAWAFPCLRTALNSMLLGVLVQVPFHLTCDHTEAYA